MNEKNGFDYFCKSMKNYADFTSRSRRKEYWFFVLFNVIISFVIETVFTMIGGRGAQSLSNILLFIIFFIPFLAVGVRRLHDTNRSGWWLLLDFVPLAGWIVLIVFFCQDSDYETNRFGPNPKLVEGDVEAASFKKSPFRDMSNFESIERLAKMRDQGILTEEEFQEQKKKFL